MKILGENSLSQKVKILLDLIFIGGIGIFISLPKSLKWYLQSSFVYLNDKIYFYLLALIAITGIFCLMLVYEVRKIFKTLERKDPFMIDNVKSLDKIGLFCFLISACYISKIFLLNSFMTLIVIMVFIIAGLFSIILAEVFRQAIVVKEENDLTI